MATQNQTRYLTSLIEDNGYDIQYIDRSLCKRFKLPFAHMSAEKFLIDHTTTAQASVMIDALKD